MSEQDNQLDEVVREFLVESAENLDQLDRDLVRLEKEPSSRELLGSVFRAVHTIKGTTGFLGFGRLGAVAHKAENLLSKLRDGALQLDAPRATVLLDVVDTMRALLARIEASGDDEDGRDLSELLDRLSALQAPGKAPSTEKAPPPESARLVKKTRSPRPQSTAAPAGPPSQPAVPPPAVVRAKPAVAPAPAAVAPAPAAVSPAQAAVFRAQAEADSPGTLVDGGVVADGGEMPSASPRPASRPAAADTRTSPSAAERTVRVDVDLLDTLMRQVGELVLARNQLISHSEELADGGRTLQRLSLIVSELQEDVMKTRMQPVDQLWSKLPRVVRDLAKQFGKEVTLSLEGGETELDRSVLEAVKDPFTHLVRNAVDHGIESPDARQALGKPRAGMLKLSASHQGGQVVLEMTDDGAGIDPKRIGAKALQAGIVTADQLARMSGREVVDLVFQPGFSTAEVVTNVSGRGVGMDVVRTNIERIGGTVDLTSKPEVGTTVRIKIPLTLAIIPALLVACRGARYAVPQAAVHELVHLDGDAVHNQVERVDSALVYRLRGHLLPLVRLEEALGHDKLGLEGRSALDIVVVQADGEPFGLAVDAIEGTQEIVVKPLAHHLKHISAYAGATILGDGGVALILDVIGIADSAGVRDGRATAEQGEEGQTVSASGTEALLLLRVGDDRRVAVPLCQVARLEELDASSVEHAGNRRAVQYRGDLLPLAWLTDVLGLPGGDLDAHLPVVVCSDGRHSVGLVAEQILDVVEEVVSMSEVGAASGVLGTAIVQGRATDLLDLPIAAQYAGVPFERTLDLAMGTELRADEEVGANAL
jgi:two-component system chemotaxis sensor kinase CheA